MLVEHEITRPISLVTRISEKMDIQEPRNPELAELSKDVAPENVMDRMAEHEQELKREAAGCREAEMVQYVLFDVDGTLIDTVDFHAWSWERTFRHFGKEVRVQAIRDQIGKGSDQLLPVFWSEEELERLGDELRKYRRALFRREYLPRAKAFPRVRELFERIKRDGKRIAVASSSKKDELGEFLEIAAVADLADVTISADDADRSKPHPDIFEAALRELRGPDPREAIVIGDTPYDAQAASSTGLETIGLLCGGFPEEQLRSAGCIAIYRDPADLLGQYEESPLADRAGARAAS